MDVERIREDPTTARRRRSDTENRLVHEHHDLRVLATTLRKANETGDVRAVFRQVGKVYQALTSHFRFEEAKNGLFHEIGFLMPRLKPMVDNLRVQHVELLSILEVIQKTPTDDLSNISVKLEEFLTLFHQHEEAEDQLLEEHFYRDIGGAGGARI